MIQTRYHSFLFYGNIKERGGSMTIGVYNNQFTPETQIYILKGVECDAMNNTYWGVYDNKEEQLQFFLNNFDYKVFNDFTYQRSNGVVNIEGDFDEIRKYNYLIYKNRKAGAGNKWIYCFITQVGYVSDSVCSISFETDVMQTWRFEIEGSFLPSYIAYEHRDRWYNSNGNLLPCVNTQPENIELGTEMVCNSVVNIFAEQFELNYIVVTMTSGFDNSEWSNFEQGVPTVLRNYVFPFRGSVGTLTQITVKNGNDGATAQLSSFNDVYEKIRNDQNFVNKCVSIKVLNSIVGIKSDSSGNALFDGSMYAYTSENGLSLLKPSTSSFLYSSSDNYIEKTEGIDLLTYFSIKINNIIYEKESKLFNFPFSFTTLTNFNGTYKVYKNEIWENPQDVEFYAIGTIGSSKSDYIPINYKVKNKDSFILDGLADSFEDGYEMTLPIVSDYTAVLLQSSQNSMNVGVSNTIRNTETANTIASMTGSAMTQQGAIQNNLRLQQTGYNTEMNKSLNEIANQQLANSYLINGVGGSMGGMLTNPLTYRGIGALFTGAGAISSELQSGANTYNQIQANNQRLSAQTTNAWQNVGATNQANNASIAVMNQLRNATTRYQGQTNIQNAIDSYRARINDAKATADTLVSGSNDVYRMLSLNLLTPKLMFFMPTEEYKNRAKLSFTIRGYATNLVELPNLHTRKSWNYIQTVKCNIVSHDIDVVDLERIKQCFDNGITLWHTKDIANYTLNNDELTDPSQVDKYGSILSHKKGA